MTWLSAFQTSTSFPTNQRVQYSNSNISANSPFWTITSISKQRYVHHRISFTTKACANKQPDQEQPPQQQQQPTTSQPSGFFARFSSLSKQILSRRKDLKADTIRNYGVAAFLSYGLFDAITYSVSFLLALRAYIAAGKVLTWSTLPQVLAIMWGINNLSRPFRIAGALALAPVVDRKIVKPISKFLTSLRTGKESNSN